MTFGEALRIQRWDDHRYYHHSRINQSLHLISALSFIAAYVTMWTSPSLAVALGWLVAMPARQAGHFFFEPRGYDEANQATHEHKEAIKVGYNLFRKVVLMAVWVLAPLVLLVSPDVWGWVPPGDGWRGIADQVATIWLAVAVGALLFRIVQLFVIANMQTGLVWGTKILTDPFHDVMLYHRAPLYVLRGERFDPIVAHAGR